MTQRQTLSPTFPKKGSSFGLQPAAAWTAILGLCLLSALLILVGAGKILNLAFPVGSCAVGAFLYFRYPILYNGFSWWIWFLVAFLRRLVDLQVGYTDPSPILLAPHLVMGFTLITLFKQLPSSYRQGGLPFIGGAVAVLYGFCIALINQSPMSAVISLLDWLIPISYGFHLFVYWRDYPSYRQNLQNVFVWGALVMGGYGVFQYLVAPAWDMAWLTNSNMITGNGYHDKARAGPMAIRVFSTMHSPEPFGTVITASTLLLLSTKGFMQFPASALSYLTLLLTMMRSAWIGWLAGLLTLFGSVKAQFQMRLIMIFLAIMICMVPLLTMEQFSDNIGNRLQTLTNVEKDSSASGRQEAFQKTIGPALTNVTGQGISRESYDSSLLVLLFHMGWMGTLPYLGSIVLMTFTLFGSKESLRDPFLGTTRAILVSILARILVNNIVFGVSSVVLWGFFGIGMAAIKYHQHQRILGEIHVNNINNVNV